MISAHAAKGLEWDVVAVPGVQEGSWPDLRPRGSLLHGAELLDRAAGGEGRGPHTAELLTDERRLFYVACTRARNRLVVTAVTSDDRAPSRFLDELAGRDVEIQGWPSAPDGRDRRSLHLAELVADLRRAVADPAAAPETAEAAAAQLARLVAAGVPGAHPDQWYGLPGLSTTAPAIPVGEPVAVSPSAVDALTACSLKAVLERRGARTPIGDPQTLGIVVHAAASGLGRGLTEQEVAVEIEAFLGAQDHLPEWQRARAGRAVTAMTAAVADWIRDSGTERRFLGSEVAMDISLPPEPGEANPVRLTGRIDWLAERKDDGRAVVTDFKTGAAQPTRADVIEHIQLATYQLGVALGAFDRVQPGLQPGGAELIHLRSGTPKVIPQPPLDRDGLQLRLHAVRSAAGRLAAAAATAQENKYCERCPVRTSCPLQPEGRQVTR